ncbi:hypothetical protein ACFLQN_03290 [Candidatus Aenigmatarchaeota archaeon]
MDDFGVNCTRHIISHDCGKCMLKMATAKFYYNPGSFPGGEVWLVGNSNECTGEFENYIAINNNLYILLNGHLLLYNGSAYGGESPTAEARHRCLTPIELSSTGFLSDCAENNLTMVFEDYEIDGFIDDFYFQGV